MLSAPQRHSFRFIHLINDDSFDIGSQKYSQNKDLSLSLFARADCKVSIY